MCTIINNEDDFFLFKIIDTKYAEELIKLGKLGFSCAKNYSELSKHGNHGQGDDEEGLFGRIRKDDIRLKSLESYYKNDLIKESYSKDNNYIDLRLAHVNFMPIYCLFSLRLNDLVKNIPYPKIGLNPVTVNISEKFLRDFRNPVQKKSLIFIEHGKEFIKRLTNKLTENGYKTVCSHMNYVERTKSFLYPPDYHPNELFCKDKSRFQNQKELRIVIKNKSLERANENQMIVNIGNLSDISQQINELPDGDLSIKTKIFLSQTP